MKETNLKEVEPVIANQINVAGPGSKLKNARTAAGLSLTDIASRLHLRESMLQMIESDNYDKSPELVFVRGYLRAYANLLNLSADEIIAEFNQLDIQDPATQTPVKKYKPIQSSKNKGKYLRRFTLFIIFVFLVIIGLWWNSQQVQTSEETSDLLNPTIGTTKAVEQPVSEQMPIVSAPTEEEGPSDPMEVIAPGETNIEPM